MRGNGGAVVKISYTGNRAPSISKQPTAITVSTGQNATFSVTASVSAPLAYQWQRNGTNISGATSSSYTFNNTSTTDNGSKFKVIVSNSFGSATSNEVTLTVSVNTPPTATILSPASGSLYSGGDVISFSGSGTDPEDGTLPASAFTWQVDFHHDTHIHPFMAATSGSTSGSFTIPTLGETSDNVWYRIHLIVKDSKGLTSEVTRDVVPRKANISLVTNPVGLALTVDAQPVTAPNTFTSVVGVSRSIGAVSPQSFGGKNYVFQSWSDGGSSTHNVNTPSSNQTYTATFVEAASGTPLAWEAENLAFSANVQTFVDQDPNFSNGSSVRAVGTGLGSYCEWTLPNVPAGNYNVTLIYKTLNTRGIVQMSLDGVNQGGAVDMFNNNGLFQQTAAVGAKTFSSTGNKFLRLTIVGQNSASSGFGMNIDKFILTPVTTTLPTTLVLETESLALISNVTTLVESDAAYSNGQSTKIFGTGAGSYAEWTLPNVPAGNYAVTVYYKSQGSRATVQGTLDGINQGSTLDMYAASDAWQVVGNLGTKNFGAAGNKLFRLTVTGKNASSSNYYMHIDKIILTPQ